ncbi:MAG: glycosyltransferase family 87 protein, partial [Vicinamibacterales bacterium]
MEASTSETRTGGVASRLSALLTVRRLAVWGTGLLVLSWSLYIYMMASPGLVDRAGRFKGTDYIYFYVMGSLVLEGRTGALYDAEAHLAEGRRRIQPELGLYAAHSNYGPQVALLFAPLARLPFGWSLAAFLALSAVCYGLSVWLVARDCAVLRAHGWLVALLATASPLVLGLIRYAQLSAFALLFWSLALVALRRDRGFTAGLAVGCLAFKPQMGLV